jgi:FtsZ-interacting cell division protein ZipA
MKNMNSKTKKWLVVIGCLAVCAVLVVLIGSRFASEKPVDQPLLPETSQPSDITVDINADKEKDVVVTTPDITESDNKDNGAVSSGTEQTIQGDPVKPEYSEEQIQDPTQKPNGEKVTEPPQPVDHGKVEPPKEPPKTNNQPQGGDTKDGKIYVPGFGWIEDNGGGGQGTTVDGDGDINKQVGNMGE